MINRLLVGEPINNEQFQREVVDEYNFNADDFFPVNNHIHEEVHDDDNEDEEVLEAEVEEDNEINEGAEPIYHNAHITESESMLMILSLMLRHNLNMTAIADIIDVIQLHCPQMDLKKNNLYKFKKFFKIDEDYDTKKHFYCPACKRKLENNHAICATCPEKKPSYFVQLPVIDQMREMFGRRDFYNKLQLRFARPVENRCLSDVYDGKLYKEWVDNNFLANPHNISFCWYTDGIPV